MIPSYLKRPKYAIFLMVFVFGLAFVLYAQFHKAWPPKANCGKTSLTLLPTKVKVGQKLSWAATGPAGKYVASVGVEQFAVEADGKVSVARTEEGVIPQYSGGDTKVCLLQGVLDPGLPAGDYTLKLFRIDGTTISEVARNDFKITG